MTTGHALIAGGGIGGLCAAIALKRIGWTVQVFEQAQELKEVGAAVQTWANAANAMDKLGILSAYAAASERIADFRVYSMAGKELINLDIPNVERKTGYSAYSVHRHEMIQVLAQFVSPNELYLGSPVQTARHTANGGAEITLANGQTYAGDLLVGADGLNSCVRTALNKGNKTALRPRYAGYVAYRGVAPWQSDRFPVEQAQIAIGDSLQVGYYPMTKGRSYWFVTINTPRGGLSRDIDAKRLLLDRIKDWVHPYPDIVAATPDDAIIQNDISDFYPTPVWGAGSMTLAGDSAHATTPNIGQGACMAVEDAVALASALRHANDIPAALRTYEAIRFKRTKAIVGQSRVIGNLIQVEGKFANAARDTVLRIMPSSFIAARTFDIYRYESPALI